MPENLHQIFMICGIAVATISYLPYFIGIFRGVTHPHIFSWLIWGMIGWIGFAAQSSDGGGVGTIVSAYTSSLCTLVVLLSLKYGEKNITRSDWISLACACLSIALWLSTDNALWAVILICLIEAQAFYPTFRKSWHKPHQEVATTFGFSALHNLFNGLAMQNYTLITSLYPAFSVLINAMFCAMLLLRRRIQA